MQPIKEALNFQEDISIRNFHTFFLIQAFNSYKFDKDAIPLLLQINFVAQGN